MDQKKKKPSLLPHLSVKRPVSIVVSLMAIIVIGSMAYYQIPIELFPSGHNYPALGVWISYPNANPQEVEEQIARPVEEEVRTISGIRSVQTYSQSNGCWTWMDFDSDTDMDAAYDQLRDRMERVRSVFPDDFERYFLRRFGRNDEPIIFMSIAFKNGEKDPFFLVDKYIKQRIERMDGVGNVEIWGADEKIIQIQVDQEKVKSHRLSMYQILNNLRKDNFAISSGWVQEGGKKLQVRSVARFKSLKDIRNLPLNELGVKIGDIAEVSYESEERNRVQRVNGGPGLLVGIYKESLANTVAISRQLKKDLKNNILNHPKLKNVDVELLFVQGELIEESIDNLTDTALWGGLFAILILLFFLRNIQMTLIMMFSIPLSLLMSLTLVYFLGWSLNIVVMMGLMISVGMVVDNGIVILENIYHKRNDNLSPQKAAIWGASEVNLAIIMATLTTITVFLPVLLIDDGGGGLTFYLQRIGIPVIFALLGSLLIALALIPLATLKLVPKGITKENSLITWAKKKYISLLNMVLRRRLDTVMIMLIMLIVTLVLSENLEQSDSDSNIGDIRLMFDLPKNFTMDDAQTFFEEVEDTINIHAKEYRVKAIDTGFRQGFGRIRVYLHPFKQQWYDIAYQNINLWLGRDLNLPMDREAVLEDLKKRLPQKPGIKFRTSWNGPSQGEGGSVSILLYGDDTGKLAILAEEVERRMSALDGVISVETDRQSGADEIKITMNRDIATRNGILPDQVAYSIMYAVRGQKLSKFQGKEKEIEIQIQFEKEDRENLMQLQDMTFINKFGQAIPLSAVAQFKISKGFGEISRKNGKTFLAIKAKTLDDDLAKVSAQIDAFMKGFTMPYGYSWQKGERFQRFREQGESFSTMFLLTLVFIYLLMAILFESFILPLSTMLAIPLAMFGGILGLLITSTSMDIMAMIGILILIGLVVNNGIVLVDMINRRRREGFSRQEAILDAGNNRFRPIIMTSFTTICGLLPMALGSGKLIGIPYAPMGRVIIGGMFVSTMLTLLIVPVFYTLFDDLSSFFQRIIGWFRKADIAGETVTTQD